MGGCDQRGSVVATRDVGRFCAVPESDANCLWIVRNGSDRDDVIAIAFECVGFGAVAQEGGECRATPKVRRNMGRCSPVAINGVRIGTICEKLLRCSVVSAGCRCEKATVGPDLCSTWHHLGRCADYADDCQPGDGDDAEFVHRAHSTTPSPRTRGRKSFERGRRVPCRQRRRPTRRAS